MMLLIFGIGTLIGSFLGLVIDRLPQGRTFVFGRSECDACHHSLKPYDLVPILSFFSTKGTCRMCHSKLSLRYPLMELITGIAYMLCYLNWGLSSSLVLSLAFVSILIVVAMIDFNTMIIYDRFHILILLIALIEMRILPGDGRNHLLGSMVVSIPYFILAKLSKGIGLGDVKLMASAGFFLGVRNTVVAFIISTLMGGIYAIIGLVSNKHKGGDAIPFGPFLCFGIFVAYLYGSSIIQWYTTLLQCGVFKLGNKKL